MSTVAQQVVAKIARLVPQQVHLDFLFCTLCAIGYYQDEMKQASCKGCLIGKFTDIKGMSECVCVPLGRYNNEATQNFKLQNVPAWKIQRRDWWNEFNNKHCPSGKFSAIEATSDVHGLQAIGYYSNEVGGASICKLCSTGQYANTDAQSTCQACNPGFFFQY